jgi:hypothetical protein
LANQSLLSTSRTLEYTGSSGRLSFWTRADYDQLFFGLNLIFNGIVSIHVPRYELLLTKQMWTLFTKALARGTSTTQVSIINTSSNFMITAVLGFVIFSESLPPLWFLGAALLIAGNVIIGRREESEPAKDGDDPRAAQNGERLYNDEGESLLNRDSVELDEDLDSERKKTRKEEDVLQLDIEEEDDQ